MFKKHLIGTYTSLISSFASKKKKKKKKNANCFCINSMKLRMAHMVEKGQLVWHKRDMSEPFAHKVSWLFFFYEKKSEKYISAYSFKKYFLMTFMLKRFLLQEKIMFFSFFLWRLHHNSLVLHLFKYLGYNWSMYPMNFVSNEIIRENVP